MTAISQLHTLSDELMRVHELANKTVQCYMEKQDRDFKTTKKVHLYFESNKLNIVIVSCQYNFMQQHQF